MSNIVVHRETVLGPRASVRDVLAGRARLVGARTAAEGRRGLVSPVEARLALGLAYEDPRAVERAYLERRSFRRDLGVLARAALAALISGGPRSRPARVHIVSATVDNLTVEEALDRIFAPPPANRSRTVFFAHAHALTLARRDRALARRFGDADVVLPDGIGIRVAAAIQGVTMRANVNGTDLFPLLCDRAAREGVPIVLVGGAPGVSAECARRMAERHGARFEIATHGFLNEDDTRRLVASIAALGRCLVLVGMGTPVQERWATTNLPHVAGATVITVGGLFDFYSGRIARAPIALREVGLEWAYRLWKEPRRLAKRYVVGNPRFLALAIWDRLRRGRSAPSLAPAPR